MPKADDYRLLELVEDKMKPYKGPINEPCSACGDGDYKMEFHDHDYVPVDKRRGPKPPPATIKRRYSLTEIEQIARGWLEVPKDDDLPERLSLSLFIQHLKKRERGVRDERDKT